MPSATTSSFGYTGLLSLGHAMFFAAGLYGAGLTIHYFGLACAGRLSCWACSRAGAGRRRRAGRAAHQRRRLHDRHHDVRAGLLPGDPLLRRCDARRRGHRAAAGSAPRRLRRTAVRSHRSRRPAHLAALLLFAVVPVRCACSGPLAVRPRAGGDPRERGTHADARLRHLPLQAAGAGWSPAPSRARRGPPMRCCSAMSGSTFASDPVLDPAAALGAARRRRHRRSGRSSARC